MHNPYVSTFLGNRFFLTNPHIDDVAIEDIAHGLAYQCRFNGQTRAFYSVAQHSLMVMSLVPEELRFSALLHDAAEAYLGDMVKPLKNLFPEFSLIEAHVMEIIGHRFGLDLTHLDPAIKQADAALGRNLDLPSRDRTTPGDDTGNDSAGSQNCLSRCIQCVHPNSQTM